MIEKHPLVIWSDSAKKIISTSVATTYVESGIMNAKAGGGTIMTLSSAIDRYDKEIRLLKRQIDKSKQGTDWDNFKDTDFGPHGA